MVTRLRFAVASELGAELPWEEETVSTHGAAIASGTHIESWLREWTGCRGPLTQAYMYHAGSRIHCGRSKR